MKNSFGTNLSVTLFGESHGPLIGAVLDGLPAGFAIDLDAVKADMEKRAARSALSTGRQEADLVHIVSGYFEGRTTGSALTLLIENKSQHSADYAQLKSRLRPGHADYPAWAKYGGYQDYRGGGHFSGRLTAPIVAAGAIARQILAQQGILCGTHMESLHGLHDIPFADDPALLAAQIEQMNQTDFAVLDPSAREAMQQEILKARENLDSVGGVLECAVTGVPAGLGEPFFDSVESVLSHLLFSIPGVKGVSFGDGFGITDLYGSQANDPLRLQEGNITLTSNHSGGINGGITNGMPIRIHIAMRPTASIYQKQESVSYEDRTEVDLEIRGRHDPAIIHRARIVVDAMVCLGILDLAMSAAATRAFEPGRSWNEPEKRIQEDSGNDTKDKSEDINSTKEDEA